jgi:hypothetical protein
MRCLITMLGVTADYTASGQGSAGAAKHTKQDIDLADYLGIGDSEGAVVTDCLAFEEVKRVKCLLRTVVTLFQKFKLPKPPSLMRLPRAPGVVSGAACEPRWGRRPRSASPSR